MTGSTEKTVPTTSNSTTTSQPLAGTVPDLLNTYNNIYSALGNYNSAIYPGQTVAPLSSTTTGLVGNAASLAGTSGAVNNASNTTLMGQLTNGTINPQASSLYSGAVGAAAGALPGAASVAGTAAGANNMIGGVTGSAQAIANGSLSANGGANQQFMNLFTPAANAVTQQYETGTAPGLASQFAEAGRSGSGAQAAATVGAENTYTQNLNNLASESLAQTYGTDVNAQLSAGSLVGNLAGQQTTDAATGQNVLQSALSGLAGQQTASASGLQGQTTNNAQVQQAATQALSSTNASQMQNILGSLQASGVIDANTQSQLTGAIQQYYAGNNEALNQYSQFLPLLTSIAGLGTSQTSAGSGTSTVYGASPLAQGIGTAAGLTGLALGVQKLV